ncbi:MAG: hypothetical protein R2818_14155 [Flavobacteriales bacterium]
MLTPIPVPRNQAALLSYFPPLKGCFTTFPDGFVFLLHALSPPIRAMLSAIGSSGILLMFMLGALVVRV